MTVVLRMLCIALFSLLNSNAGYSSDDCTIDFEHKKYPVICKRHSLANVKRDIDILINRVIPLSPQSIYEAVNIIKDEFSKDIYNRYNKELKFKYFVTLYFGRHRPLSLGVPYCPSVACFGAFEKTVDLEIDITHKVFTNLNKFDVLSMLCHEVGHGIAGGETHKAKEVGQFEKEALPYVEGEAEYFIPKCLKRLIDKGHIDLTEYDFRNIDPDVISVCGDDEQCKLILQSSKNFSREYLKLLYRNRGSFLEDAHYASIFKKKSEEPSYLKTDNKKVLFKTSHDHPNFQCRFDTVKNAYFKKGRPRCWSAKK